MVEWNEMGKEEEGVKNEEPRGKVKIGERENFYFFSFGSRMFA